MTVSDGVPTRNRNTPGVYITEFDAFPSSVVGVATATPVFIGYTQIAVDPATNAPLYHQPVAVHSPAEYARYFGGDAPVPGFSLWRQMQLFYANGGGACYVVSVGSYWKGEMPVTTPVAVPEDWTPGIVTASALLDGLTAAGRQAGPTMILIPEACQLSDADYATVVQAMLTQAGTLQDRMAILDLPDCLTTIDYAGLLAAQAKFWDAVAPAAQYVSYGAAYAPALLLPDQVTAVAPSGSMAGIWSQNDTQKGVWFAPAGTTMAVEGVWQPAYKMTDDQQGSFNVPLNGMAIDIIKAFTGYGNVVWGARTLDGNSNDYRYIQVRRTLIYVEQSINAALRQYVFAANDGPTWMTVTAAVSNFLTQLWQQGGLMGDKASDAFMVQCGLGSTMTGQDILDGYMVVTVALQMVRPAEFIELTFRQQMQTS